VLGRFRTPFGVPKRNPFCRVARIPLHDLANDFVSEHELFLFTMSTSLVDTRRLNEPKHRTMETSMQSEQPGDEDPQASWLGEEEASVIFGPLREERLRIDRIVNRLEVTSDLVERADLASELVRSVSRYEDTIERSLVGRFAESLPAVLEELEDERDQLREGMTVIHKRTMGIDPRNVHASDGQGFEDTLEDILHRLRALLLGEDRQIAALIASLGTQDRQQLSEDIAHTFRSASERPNPPHTAVGRFFSNAHVKLDHKFEDVATPSHPGAHTIDG
jgi:hypothetical protein